MLPEDDPPPLQEGNGSSQAETDLGGMIKYDASFVGS